MQTAVTNRTRWPLWLVTVLGVALSVACWWPSSDDAVMSTPILPVASAPVLVVAPVPTPVIAPALIQAAEDPVNAALSASTTFRLVGTVIAADDADSFALVRLTANSQLMQLRAGDRVEAMTVSAIESDKVVLAGAGQAIVIKAARRIASPVPSRAVGPAPASDVEPAWAGDPAPFGH